MEVRVEVTGIMYGKHSIGVVVMWCTDTPLIGAPRDSGRDHRYEI